MMVHLMTATPSPAPSPQRRGVAHSPQQAVSCHKTGTEIVYAIVSVFNGIVAGCESTVFQHILRDNLRMMVSINV